MIFAVLIAFFFFVFLVKLLCCTVFISFHIKFIGIYISYVCILSKCKEIISHFIYRVLKNVISFHKLIPK